MVRPYFPRELYLDFGFRVRYMCGYLYIADLLFSSWLVLLAQAHSALCVVGEMFHKSIVDLESRATQLSPTPMTRRSSYGLGYKKPVFEEADFALQSWCPMPFLVLM
jgi:hypothetical protein